MARNVRSKEERLTALEQKIEKKESRTCSSRSSKGKAPASSQHEDCYVES